MSETQKVKVKQIKINNDSYLYDKSTNELYDPETKEVVGNLVDREFTINAVEKTSTYKGWKYTIEISPIFTKEEVIEINSAKEPTEWEYNFDIDWNGVIERKGEEVDIEEIADDINFDEPVGDLVYYSKKRLTTLECYRAIDKIHTESLTKSYKYIFRWKHQPPVVIQSLITDEEIEIDERYRNEPEAKPKVKPKRKEEYKTGDNPLWDELIAASTENERKAIEFAEKAGLNREEQLLYERLMDDFKSIKEFFTEPRKIDITGKIWDTNILILSLYKFYGYSEAEFNADKRNLIRQIDAQYEADRSKNEAKYNKARAKNPNDMFAGREYFFYRQNTLSIGEGGLQVLLLDVDTLIYDNPVSNLFIKIRDALTPVAEPVATAVATAVPDILDMKVTEFKSLKSIYETKIQEYKANKSIQLKKEVLQIKTELEQLAEEIKSIRIGKEGKGIDNNALYEKAKQIANEKYKKPSAYKSGFIVKTYKELGGTYTDDGKPKNLKRWFKEEWKDIGNKEYPVYRPTKRITKDTPLTPEEIKPSNLKKQIKLKQEIKGNANLPPFQEKTGGMVYSLGQPADKISQYDEVYKWSNPKRVQELAKKYLGEGATIFRSTKKDKKYMVYNPNTEKWVHFGQINYEDFTKHKDEKRRKNYLTRTANMRGNWKDDKYSANNLSRNLLW